jgi:alanine dehydrogenase
MEILWISDDELRKILSMSDAMEVVEDAFKMENAEAPSKLYLNFENGDLRAMPAYIPDLKIAGVKVVNVHPRNPEKGLPTVMAIIVLNDPNTGRPISVMEGTYITDIRTGACGGVAARYLAREDSEIVGLVGAGKQARTQLLALNEVMGIEKVKVASRTTLSAERFKQEMGKFICGDIVVCSIKDACECDILVTSTPVRSPIIKDEWVHEGTHINAIGADAKGKEELDPNILKRAKIVVDDIAQASSSGEINVPLEKGIIKKSDIYAELGDILKGKKQGREEPDEITVFDSTGLAIHDIATANFAYHKAISKGIGTRLKFQ